MEEIHFLFQAVKAEVKVCEVHTSRPKLKLLPLFTSFISSI